MILAIDTVSKTFRRAGRRIDALSGVSLELDCGDFVGILGPSGAGKTTLLRIVAGLEKPDSGSVRYCGRALDEMSKAEAEPYRRREVGCVLGSQHLIPGLSAQENVTLPLLLDGWDRHRARQATWDTLETVGAGHCAHARPAELSTGERQRVAIAQALASKPRVLLADEPVSNLDFFERDSLLAVLQSLARDADMTVLIADTDATALMRASPILYLSNGKLIAQRSEAKMAEVVELSRRALGKRS